MVFSSAVASADNLLRGEGDRVTAIARGRFQASAPRVKLFLPRTVQIQRVLLRRRKLLENWLHLRLGFGDLVRNPGGRAVERRRHGQGGPRAKLLSLSHTRTHKTRFGAG